MRVRASASDEQSTIRATAKFWKLRPLETYDECQVSREKGIIVRGSAFVSLQIFISCNSILGAVTQGTLPPPVSTYEWNPPSEVPTCRAC